MDKIQLSTKEFIKKDIPKFGSGDTLSVDVRVREGSKERIQKFEGVVIARHGGNGLDGSFTLRKITNGVGVERIFPLHSPLIASFDLKPELGRMLLESYNYKCRDELCILVAILEKTNYRIDVLFNEPKKGKYKNSKELQIAKKKYKNVLQKFSHPYGDAHSLINIYKEYSKYKYDTTNKNNQIITEKLGNAKEWCKNHFLNENKLNDLKYEIKQIKRKFIPIMQRAKLYSKIPNTLFAEIPIQRSNNIDINILKSIIAGNFINIIKADHKKYISCFPEEKLSGNISRDSLYKLLNNSSRYVVYCEFKSIFNRMSFGIISKITPSIITELKNNDTQKIIFSKC